MVGCTYRTDALVDNVLFLKLNCFGAHASHGYEVPKGRGKRSIPHPVEGTYGRDCD